MFNLVSPMVWAAASVALAVGGVGGYKAGHWMGDRDGYARAISEVSLATEKEVAHVLEVVAKSRRDRAAGRVPNEPDKFARD